MQRTRRAAARGGSGGDDAAGVDIRNAPFLVKLFHMLGDSTLSACLRWSEDGRSVVVANPRLFTQEIREHTQEGRGG